MIDKKSLVELLPDLIVKEFHEKFYPDDTGKNVLLVEEKNKSSCKWVELKVKQQSIPCFCFSIDKKREKDKGDPIFPFFNPEVGGICSKNDTILICQKQQKIYVFLIELKAGGRKSLKQLKAAQIFIQFIFARVKLYDLCKENLENLEFRGIVFSCRKTPDEGMTKHKKIEFNDRNGLLVTEQECNQSYNLTVFLK